MCFCLYLLFSKTTPQHFCSRLSFLLTVFSTQTLSSPMPVITEHNIVALQVQPFSEHPGTGSRMLCRSPEQPEKRPPWRRASRLVRQKAGKECFPVQMLSHRMLVCLSARHSNIYAMGLIHRPAAAVLAAAGVMPVPVLGAQQLEPDPNIL